MPGQGPGSQGVWFVPGEQPAVVKRLSRPSGADSELVSRPGALGWWRREADVITSRSDEAFLGLVTPGDAVVSEDEDGITLQWAWRSHPSVLPATLVGALARFATVPVPEAAWSLDDQWDQRLAALEHRGGWTHLARTPAADLAAVLWQRRRGVQGRLRASARVAAHGDVTPGNVLGLGPGGHVVMADWASFGSAPPGHDLGYYALSVQEPLARWVELYIEGLREHGLTVDASQVLHAARAAAVFTAFTRADWALGRVAGGEGALAAKVRHPAVAVHLRVLEKWAPEAFALAGVDG